nr:TrbC/VirB2 family protein [Bartonella sp. WD12.1]
MVFLLFFILGNSAYAAGIPTDDVVFPWETPLKRIMRLISGPVTVVVSLFGIAAAGGVALIFRNDISDFLMRIIYVVLFICIIVFGMSLFRGMLFSGAVVPENMVIGEMQWMRS